MIDRIFGIEHFLIKALLYASVSFIALWLIIALIRCCMLRLDKLERTTAGYKRKLFVFLGFLIASVLCFRYAIGLCGIVWPLDQTIVLTPIEEFFYSFVYSLQMFGGADGLNEYINDVRVAMTNLFGVDSPWTVAGPIYASVLSAVAPVAGGAVIFEIIANIFPNILIWLSYQSVVRSKYYFSELNENALALIKSINKEHKGKLFKPTVIITDSYIDDESETSVELINEAKLLGAICVKNDIVHIRKTCKGKRKFFLIDADQTSNVQKLIELSNNMKTSHVKNSEFYVFITSDIFYAVEKQVRANFARGLKKEQQPVVIPVKGYRNIILNMFSDLPLFEPIVEKYAANRKEQKLTDLNVTILGMGDIGTEMLRGTYWCGQMLGCKLNITMVSKESKDEFEQKLNHINPEILKSADPNDPLLRIYRKDIFAPKGAKLQSQPYCSFNYISEDISSEDFISLFDNSDAIKNTDYFFVALGSDEENIMMANRLRRIVGHSHMTRSDDPHTVIAYVVFDPNLCKALNEKNLYSYSENGNDIYMKALGSIEQIYSVGNVFLTEFDLAARKTQKKYYSSQETDARKENLGASGADSYDYASSIAKIVHKPYRAFSAGVWERSVFDCSQKSCVDDYESQKIVYYQNFVKKMIINARNKKADELNEFAWLEHRRWNAYMRSEGYRGPIITKNDGKQLDEEKTLEYIKRFLFVNKAQKNLELKRHLCLTECSVSGLKAKMDEYGKHSDYEVWKVSDDASYKAICPDMLDEVAIIMSNEAYKPRRDLSQKEFKRYDYPSEDLGKYVTVEVFSQITGLTKKKIEKLCKKEKLYGCVTIGENNTLMIPEDNAQKFV